MERTRTLAVPVFLRRTSTRRRERTALWATTVIMPVLTILSLLTQFGLR